MPDARAAILARLRAAPNPLPPPPAPPMPARDWGGDEKLERFVKALGASHAEVHVVSRSDWPGATLRLLADRGALRLLHAPVTAHGQALAGASAGADGPSLVPYEGGVGVMKDTLVHGVDAAFTSTVGGIAETGSLILWPTPQEPRLMSLLPPIHVALVEAAHIHATLVDAMRAERWSERMPTNVVLVSGPSKTADIEQTLAYGVHGPRELIVLVVT